MQRDCVILAMLGKCAKCGPNRRMRRATAISDANDASWNGMTTDTTIDTTCHVACSASRCAGSMQCVATYIANVAHTAVRAYALHLMADWMQCAVPGNYGRWIARRFVSQTSPRRLRVHRNWPVHACAAGSAPSAPGSLARWWGRNAGMCHSFVQP